MLKVTADTNIYISGFVFGGLPRLFIDAANAARFELAISDPIETELRRILEKKFAWPAADIAEVLAVLAGCTRRARPTQRLEAVPADPDDNRVLECAVAAGSRYLVTGDGDLLQLGRYEGIAILRVADFLRLLLASR